MRTVRFFLSSPDDVAEERKIAEQVIRGVGRRYSDRLRLEIVDWKKLPMASERGFQDQIPPTRGSDFVLMLLWSKLGSPPGSKRPNGTPYESGTIYEYETAREAHASAGRPEIFLYRKSAPPLMQIGDGVDETAVLERIRGYKAVAAFVDAEFRASDGSAKRAYHTFANTVEFEENLEHHLDRWISEKLSQWRSDGVTGAPEPAQGSDTAASAPATSPFRGLQRFEREHADLFFGRSRAKAEVLHSLRQQAARGCPFVLVFGGSGVGKTSFARAGVLPHLTEPGVVAGVDLWRWTIFEPSDSIGDLCDGLAASLLAEDALPQMRDALDKATLAELLRRSPETAAREVRRQLDRIAGDGKASVARLAMLIDPLEEVFTRAQADDAERDRLFDAIAQLARSGGLWVLCTMRSDFYDRCGRHPQLLELMAGAGHYLLSPPTIQEIRRMVRTPAEHAGLRFEHRSEVDQSLDDLIMEDYDEQGGTLPLLEFALDEIWRRSGAATTRMLSFAAYEGLGGLMGALEHHAEETLDSVAKPLQFRLDAAFAKICRHVVDVPDQSGKTVVRKYARKDALLADPDARVLGEAMIEARLLMTDQDDEAQPVVTLCHEAMLKHWSRLKSWAAANREFLMLRSRIAEAAGRWKEEHEDESWLLQPGKPVVEGQHLLERRDELDPLLIRFVDASIARANREENAQRERERLEKARARRHAATMSVVAAVALVAAGLAGFYYLDANRSYASAEKLANSSNGLVRFLLDDVRDALDDKNGRDRKLIQALANKVQDHVQSLEHEPGHEPLKLQGADSLLSLALSMMKMRQFKEANELATSALELFRGRAPDTDIRIAECFEIMGRSYEWGGDYSHTLPPLEEAGAIVEKGNHHGTQVSASLHEDFGEVARRESRYIEAEEWYRRSLQESPNDGNDLDALTRIRAWDRLGEVCRNGGKLDESERWHRQAVAFLRETEGIPPGDRAETIGNLGVLLGEKGGASLKDAEDLLREALAERIRGAGPNNQEVAADHYKLARVLIAAGRLDEAELEIGSSIAILDSLVAEGTLKPGHLRIAKANEVVADLRLRRNDVEGADRASQRVLDIRRAILKAPHLDLVKALLLRSRVLEAMGDADGAKELASQADAMKKEHAAREQEALARIGNGRS